jgi:hypothetical protein
MIFEREELALMPYVARDQLGFIACLFGIEQPGVAEEFLPDDDPEVVTYLSQPRRVEAMSHLYGGLTITDASALAGTYRVSGEEGQYINAVQTCWNDNGSMPNGKSVVELFDIMGTLHNFDKNSMRTFARAARDFTHNCNLYAQGETINLPPNQISLTTAASDAAPPFAYDHENRIRALEGLPPLTFDEFMTRGDS